MGRNGLRAEVPARGRSVAHLNGGEASAKATGLWAGRWWIGRDRGRIDFQVHVGASSAQTIQLGGVLVPHDARGRGHATAGVRGICARLLERCETVTLYCDEANQNAHPLYERVEFRERFRKRSYLLKERAVIEARLGYG